MKERPILMSAPMVRAILSGTKTQTRRVLKPQPDPQPAKFIMNEGWPRSGKANWLPVNAEGFARGFRPIGYACPYATEVGDKLWVRETFYCNSLDYPEPTDHARENLLYRADAPHELDGESVENQGGGWKPSIFMPRWASRITLEVTEVRVERLQDITEEDARAEGMTGYEEKPPRPGMLGFPPLVKYARLPQVQYQRLWTTLNGKMPGHTWEDNPWVWVVSFNQFKESDCK